jgi:hypothetical protein
MPVRSWLRLSGYAAGLLVVLAAGYLIGRHTLDPASAQAGDSAPTVFGGQAVSASGYTLSADETTLPAGQAATFRLHVSGPDGKPVLRYGVVGERLMRLALVRRDLSGYRTLAPSLSADGTWSAQVTLPDAGSWRLLADFTALDAASRATPLLLGLDLSAAGTFTPQAGPPPATDTTVDGYTLTLTATPHPGRAEPLLVSVRRDGQPAAVGPAARLSLIRDGDLAFASIPADPDTARGVLRFAATLPSTGRYAVFVDFTADATSHTAAFTLTSP